MQALINNDSFDADQQQHASSDDESQPSSPFPWASSHSSPERNPPQPSLLLQGTPDCKWVGGRHSMTSNASSASSPEPCMADLFMAAHRTRSEGSSAHTSVAPSPVASPGNDTVVELGKSAWSPAAPRAVRSGDSLNASCLSPPPSQRPDAAHLGASPAMSPFTCAPSTPLPGGAGASSLARARVLHTPQTPATPASCLKGADRHRQALLGSTPRVRFSADPLGLAACSPIVSARSPPWDSGAARRVSPGAGVSPAAAREDGAAARAAGDEVHGGTGSFAAKLGGSAGEGGRAPAGALAEPPRAQAGEGLSDSLGRREATVHVSGLSSSLSSSNGSNSSISSRRSLASHPAFRDPAAERGAAGDGDALLERSADTSGMAGEDLAGLAAAGEQSFAEEVQVVRYSSAHRWLAGEGEASRDAPGAGGEGAAAGGRGKQLCATLVLDLRDDGTFTMWHEVTARRRRGEAAPPGAVALAHLRGTYEVQRAPGAQARCVFSARAEDAGTSREGGAAAAAGAPERFAAALDRAGLVLEAWPGGGWASGGAGDLSCAQAIPAVLPRAVRGRLSRLRRIYANAAGADGGGSAVVECAGCGSVLACDSASVLCWSGAASSSSGAASVALGASARAPCPAGAGAEAGRGSSPPASAGGAASASLGGGRAWSCAGDAAPAAPPAGGAPGPGACWGGRSPAGQRFEQQLRADLRARQARAGGAPGRFSWPPGGGAWGERGTERSTMGATWLGEWAQRGGGTGVDVRSPGGAGLEASAVGASSLGASTAGLTGTSLLAGDQSGWSAASRWEEWRAGWEEGSRVDAESSRLSHSRLAGRLASRAAMQARAALSSPLAPRPLPAPPS